MLLWVTHSVLGYEWAGLQWCRPASKRTLGSHRRKPRKNLCYPWVLGQPVTAETGKNATSVLRSALQFFCVSHVLLSSVQIFSKFKYSTFSLIYAHPAFLKFFTSFLDFVLRRRAEQGYAQISKAENPAWCKIFKAGNHPIGGCYCKCNQIVYSDENIFTFEGLFKQSNICLADNKRK